MEFEFLVNGKKVSQSECRQMAEEGNLEACNQIALWFDTEMDEPSKAAHWYKTAAKGGYSAAQSNLAQCYERGEGVPRDKVLAYMWSSLAINNGMAYLMEKRDELEEELSEAEVFEAQKLARERYM